MKQARQTERPLKRVFEVMVTGIDGLIIIEAPTETFTGPIECLGHKQGVAVRKKFAINRVRLSLDFVRYAGINRSEHDSAALSLERSQAFGQHKKYSSVFDERAVQLAAPLLICFACQLMSELLLVFVDILFDP
jgi:hypothetical protein